uniref:Uncharacterized protein n=1 Tax=Anolis carolinensis TaxID=28377 RepID=A0A803T3S9_ANOCA
MNVGTDGSQETVADPNPAPKEKRTTVRLPAFGGAGEQDLPLSSLSGCRSPGDPLAPSRRSETRQGAKSRWGLYSAPYPHSNNNNNFIYCTWTTWGNYLHGPSGKRGGDHLSCWTTNPQAFSTAHLCKERRGQG